MSTDKEFVNGTIASLWENIATYFADNEYYKGKPREK